MSIAFLYKLESLMENPTSMVYMNKLEIMWKDNILLDGET